MGRGVWAWGAAGCVVLAACGSDPAAERAELSRLGQGCLLDSDCGGAEACVFQKCHVECETKQDCKEFGFDTICLKVDKVEKGKPSTVNVCQLPEEELCGPQRPCPSPLVCTDQGKCRSPCTTDGDCGKNQTCIENACIDDEEPLDGGHKLCIYNSDCDPGLYCLSSVCTEQCKKDIDCPSGTTCVNENGLNVCKGPSGSGGTGGTDGGTGGTMGGTGGLAGSGGTTGGTGGTGGTTTKPPGAQCSTGGECSSGVCLGSLCQQPSCTDSTKNGSETDIDCGGSCPGCPDGVACTTGSDCSSGVCGTGSNCASPSCTDGVKNGAESGIDCGGFSSCGLCGEGKGCVSGADCDSGLTCTPGNNPPASCVKAYTLTVALAGTGTGEVTGGSGASAIKCPGKCSVSVASGVPFNLSASAASGSTFDGWGAPCSGTGSCSVPMTADTTVTATFGGGTSSGTWGNALNASYAVIGPVSGGGVLGALNGTNPCGTTLQWATYLARWDGSGKCIGTNTPKTLTGLGNNAVLGLGATAAGDVIGVFQLGVGNWDFGGAPFSCGTGGGVAIARFSGTTWALQNSPSCIPLGNQYYPSARKAAVGGGKVVVIGTAQTGDNPGGGALTNGQSFVATYSDVDGSALNQTQLGGTNPFGGSGATSVAVSGTDVIVAGWCDNLWDKTGPQWLADADGGGNVCVAKLTSSLGVTWMKTLNSSVGGNGYRPSVEAMALSGGDIVIVGHFVTQLNSLPAKSQWTNAFIALLDGATGEIKNSGSALRLFGASSSNATFQAVSLVNSELWVAGIGPDVDFGTKVLASTGPDLFYARFDLNLGFKDATGWPASGGAVGGLVPAIGGQGAVFAGVGLIPGVTTSYEGFVMQLAP